MTRVSAAIVAATTSLVLLAGCASPATGADKVPAKPVALVTADGLDREAEARLSENVAMAESLLEWIGLGHELRVVDTQLIALYDGFNIVAFASPVSGLSIERAWLREADREALRQLIAHEALHLSLTGAQLAALDLDLTAASAELLASASPEAIASELAASVAEPSSAYRSRTATPAEAVRVVEAVAESIGRSPEEVWLRFGIGAAFAAAEPAPEELGGGVWFAPLSWSDALALTTP